MLGAGQPTGRRRRPRGIPIRPERVKEARRSAGLSLGAVAGRDLSRTAIHLIENGRARPSIATLRLIARRTGKPVEFFLTTPPAPAEANTDVFDRVERLIVTERFDEARSLVDTILEAGISPRAAHLRGRIAVREMQPLVAREYLEQAIAAYTDAGDEQSELESRMWLAKALFLLEDPSALGFAEATFTRSRRLNPRSPGLEAALLEMIGATRVARHEWHAAIAAYDEAVAAAGSLRDLAQVGQMYDNLSIAYRELGELSKAEAYSQRALAMWSVETDRRVLARLENNMAVVLMAQNRLDEAEPHLQHSLQLCEELHMDQARPHALLSLAELAMARFEWEVAADYANSARELSASLGKIMTEALANQYLGRIAVSLGDQHWRQHFEAALALLESANAPERLLECRIAYARTLREHGDAEAALDEWEAAAGALRPHLSEQAPQVPFLMVG